MTDPVQQIELLFADARKLPRNEDPLRKDLSAIVRVGDCLFMACDETASVERLQRLAEDRYGCHRQFYIGDVIELPAGPGGEMDIEGMAASEGYLWILGSHSLKRSKPKLENNNATDALERMETIECDPNRFFLGRVPLEEESPGVFRLVGEVDGRRAGVVKMKSGRNSLFKWLRRDPLIRPFLKIPSKENGLDLEGVAARGERLWLGLRGPVLRGHAVVIDLQMHETKRGLRARKVEGKRRFRRHLLDTQGLGIRDLRMAGDDLLMLVGPTMSLEGPAYVLRWRDAIHDDVSGVIDPSRIEQVCELPYQLNVDHPEGLELWPEAGPTALFVLYDAPAPERLGEGRSSIKADIFLP